MNANNCDKLVNIIITKFGLGKSIRPIRIKLIYYIKPNINITHIRRTNNSPSNIYRWFFRPTFVSFYSSCLFMAILYISWEITWGVGGMYIKIYIYKPRRKRIAITTNTFFSKGNINLYLPGHYGVSFDLYQSNKNSFSSRSRGHAWKYS